MDDFKTRNEETIQNVMDIVEQIEIETEKETVDEDKLTKLMFEQLLRGMYLN